MLRSLFNIDGWQLLELSAAQRRAFISDPVRFVTRCDDSAADAIWREVCKRQRQPKDAR
jgi:hypothetical protein